MPSKTAKQKLTMQAAAHNPAFAKKVGIPVKVAQDFSRADKRKRARGSGLVEVLVALTLGTILVTGATVTGKQAELCTAMGGTFTPAYAPGDVCPGGKWSNLLAAGVQRDFFECAPGATLAVCPVGQKPARECRAVGSGATTLPVAGDCS
jgi:hypothetical protein